ncbi:RHS repeat-associated core domain-containing protein [Saccharibacillus brassicae]
MTERSITKNGQATTTRYYYDGANIIAEGTVAADGSVTFKARYVRGAQLIYREDANNQKAYYQHNGHGDVTGLVKADGTALNSYTYDIWGNPLTADVQVENPFGYSGEFWDEDTGLQYLRSRWYDPSIGRFIQEDTFEGYVNRPSSLNPYTYVENNPLKYVDPSGHEFEPSIGVGKGPTPPTPPTPPPFLKWDNPASRPTWGHTWSDHGQARTESALYNRARSKLTQQGRWWNNKAAAAFIAPIAQRGYGVYDVALPANNPSRTFFGNNTNLKADRAKIAVRADGSVRTAYPYHSDYRTNKYDYSLPLMPE